MASSVRNFALEYNPDYHIGLVPWDASDAVAANNTRYLTAFLKNSWKGGSLDFYRGPITNGAANRTLRLPPVGYYFKGPIETSDRVGAKIVGGCGAGYQLLEGHFDSNPSGTIGGNITRFIRIDGENGGPVLRCRGAGFIMEDIHLYGKRNVGTTTPVGIEVEDRETPPSGQHIFRNIKIFDCTTAIDVPGGYYNAGGTFVPLEAHADMMYFDHVHTETCDTYFRCNSQQSVAHVFVFPFATQGSNPFTMFKVKRGGKFEVYSPRANGQQITLLEITDSMNPNCDRFDIHGFQWDHVTPSLSTYLTLFKNAGASTDAYAVRIAGHINNPQLLYDESKLVQRAGTPALDLLFDVTHLPLTNFTLAGYPWYRPV